MKIRMNDVHRSFCAEALARSKRENLPLSFIPQMHLTPGTIVVASNRNYEVAQDGSYRRMERKEWSSKAERKQVIKNRRFAREHGPSLAA